MDLSTRLVRYLDSHGATIRRRDLRAGCQDSFRPYYRTYWQQLETHLEPRDAAPRRWVMGMRYRPLPGRPEIVSWAVGTPVAIVRAFLVSLANHRHGRATDLRFLHLAPSATSSWSGAADLYTDAWSAFADQGVTSDDQESIPFAACHTTSVG